MAATDLSVRPPLALGSAQGNRLPFPVILYLLAVLTPATFLLGPLNLSAMRLLLMLFLVPLFFQLLAGRFGKMHLVDWAFIAHLVWIALSIMINNPDRLVEAFGSLGIEFLGGYLVGRAYVRTRTQFIALCKILGVICFVFILPLAIYETQTGRPIVIDAIRSLPGVSSWFDYNKDQRLGLERAQVVFTHPIHLGLFGSVCFSLVFVSLHGSVSTMRRFILGGAVALCCLASLSSAGWMALVLQFGLVGWYLALRQVEQRWMVLLWLFVFCYILIDILSNRTPLVVMLHYATFSAHTAYWRMIIFDWGVRNIFGDAAEGIPAAPFFGIGFNDWVRPWFMHSGSMDNFWLVIAVRHGLPALAFLVGGMYWAIWKIMRRDFAGDSILLSIRRGWVFTFIGLTVILCTVHVWMAVYSFIFFIFGAGIWMLTTKPEGAENNAPAEEGAVPRNRYSRFTPSARATTRTPSTTSS